MNKSRQGFWPKARKPLQAAEDATEKPPQIPRQAQTHSAAASCRADRCSEEEPGNPQITERGQRLWFGSRAKSGGRETREKEKEEQEDTEKNCLKSGMALPEAPGRGS